MSPPEFPDGAWPSQPGGTDFVLLTFRAVRKQMYYNPPKVLAIKQLTSVLNQREETYKHSMAGPYITKELSPPASAAIGPEWSELDQ